MSKLTADQDRIFNVLLDDLREHHREELMSSPNYNRHSAISGEDADIDCLTCAHINEAEYELAVAANPIPE
jgi:hypothetical protein